MELSQEKPLISSDPSTKGFDLSAGSNWIYPLNYQYREYQYNITKNSLFNNTLVCLPTGLGKTLIAAVVMYNFWRWYPRGKIVFMAPTKPLVAQQISACHDIMGIPSGDTIELTGSMNQKNRQIAWMNKRVIFATPQVFQNDLEKSIVSGELVRCVIIDEAHKALGKHSYCESIRLLKAQNTCFRVLALSATPGSKIENVCQVMKNLLISNLELRDETSPDIIPYLNKRQMDIILVPLGKELARFKEKYVSIMDNYVRLLVHYNLLKGDASTISKGRIFYLYRDFQSQTNRPSNYGQIMKTLSRCISLYHAYELLIRHGLRAFANFCQAHSADSWMTDEPALQNLLDEILSFLGPFPNLRPLPDGSVEEIPKDLVLGHTKFHKLKSLLLEHFEKFAAKNEETRAIVFVEYRDSVNEVYVSLLQLKPILRPKMFVGQAGQKQKQQKQAMEAFRNNEANVLISTSVGEEGLDVGEVDLIVCFDISQNSPIRLVQRMGRTGRRRDGRIIMLVTDGKEHQALKSTIAKKDSLNKKVLHSSNVVSAMYEGSPRMVPPDFNPVCSKMHIMLQPKTPAEKDKKRKRKQKEDDPQKENKKKVKATKTHTVLRGEVEKGKSTQSSMLQFLKKPSTTKEPDDILVHVSQSSLANQLPTQIPQPDSIKLLTSDTAAIDFLTLCAIKASKLDGVRNKMDRMDKTYLPVPAHDEMDNFFDYPVPDLDILNYIVYLEKRTECSSPEFNEGLEFDQIENDIDVPKQNDLNAVEYRDTNKSPAIGKFNYEDLFDDSCESDEMVLLDDQQCTMLDNTLKGLSEHEKSRKCQSIDESKNAKNKISQTKSHNHHAALLKDDHYENSSIAERLVDQVAHANEQKFEEENNFLKIGCFESLLDQSSDSDIPSSQTELDLRNSTKTRGPSPANYTAFEKHDRVGIGKSTNKPSRSSATHTVSGYQNKMYPLTNKTSESLTDNLQCANSEKIKMTTSNVNSSKINKSMNVNKQFHCNDRKASCLATVPDQPMKINIDMNTSSRFHGLEHNKRSDPNIGYNFKDELSDTVKPVNTIISKTSDCNENINNCFAESLDEDDDVIFIGEVTGVTSLNESRKESINVRLSEDDDEIVFEKEISFAESKKANESNANCSKSTITQILELIENSTPRKVNLSKISRNSKNLSNPNKFELVNALTTTQAKKAFSLHDETALKDKLNSTDACTSYYFNKERDIIKNLDDSLKAEELPADLDLSDIKWDDDFADDKEYADCKKVAGVNKKADSFKTKSDGMESFLEYKIQSKTPITDITKTSPLIKKGESFKTNSNSSGFSLKNKIQIEKSFPDKRETSALNKREASFKTNSDNSEGCSKSNMQSEKPSPVQIADFDLGDYEWDSDFETPANPVASLKQFSNSNNIATPSKLENASVSGLASQKLLPKSSQSTALSSFVAPVKKKLSTKKSKIHKPSTSRNYFDDGDSDFEDDFFHKFDGKMRKDHHPNTSYVLTTTRNPMNLKEEKFLQREKENAEPNSGLINLSSFAAKQKDRDIRKVPFSRGAATADRNKVRSLDRDSYKRKKSQRRNRVQSEFLNYEAEVSSDTTSGTSGEDDDLEGFVSHTQQVPETVDMQSHYLQSIRDVHKADAFHFRKPRTIVPDDNIFSQPTSHIEESAYLHDSFCVSGGEDDLFTETHEDSLLELTERRLNSKKRKRSKNGRASVTKKKKRAARSSDTNSSEDETEKLRKQILEESMILKRNKD